MTPILYSFRRCPYAIRARLGLAYAGVSCELREIVLRDKPAHMLEISPKGTVPVLLLPDGEVIDESRDILMWALAQNDPDDWLYGGSESYASLAGRLIDQNDDRFKPDLDLYKYADRHPEGEGLAARERAMQMLGEWNGVLAQQTYLSGARRGLADVALFPFVRQFAHVNRDWFYDQDLPHVIRWLTHFLEWPVFTAIMKKLPVWDGESDGIPFPPDIRV